MVLDDLLSFTSPDRSVFNHDPMINALNQGAQKVGFHILNQLKDSKNDRTSRTNANSDSKGTRPRVKH
jgi:hypothetical protein